MRFFLFALSTFTAVTFCLSGEALHAENWTRFRGPNGSGISEAKTVPVKWAEKEINWKAELPGIGHSSPVVWGDRLFVTAADVEAGKRFLICLKTTDGSITWKRTADFAKYRLHSNNSFASNTPAVDANHVYVLWQSKQESALVAFDHDGQEAWRYDMGAYLHGQGGGTSPIVHEGLVFVSNDHSKGSFLVAVDSKAGKEVWKIPRAGKRACYSTPCVFPVAGGESEIVFTHSFEGVIGVASRTGKPSWKVDPFGRAPQRAVGSPLVTDGLVIASSGARVAEKIVVAIRPRPMGDGSKAEEVFRVTKIAPHVPTPLAYNKRLYLWTDTGVVGCVNMKTGKTIWQKRVGGNFFGSPVCIDGKLYSVDLEGNVVVLATGDKYEELARNALGEPSRATPAVADGRLFVRTYSHVFSIGGAK
jgi:outer membrane protein assembly factor BamB